VAVKLLWEEADTEHAEALLEAHPTAWVAPSLLAYEVANVVRFSRSLPDNAQRTEALRAFRRIRITYVEPTADDLAASLELALAKDTTAYDAVYLVLARRLDLPLVTADKRFAARAKDPRVRLLGQAL
jgi:predicted nucleic acid-binding protein